MHIPSGYILLHKPPHISSFFDLKKLQYHLFEKANGTGKNKIKIGHCGTLDPLAEGLMICGVEKGTKVLEYLLTSDKKYTATLFLGKESETDDDEGEKYDIANKQETALSLEEITAILPTFCGKIEQTPPMYSALKIQGKRACDRVRNGQEVQMKPRQVEIFSIEIDEYAFPYLTLSVHCGSGTYIRSLARDIGRTLQTGAHLTRLIRTHIGDFSLDDAKKRQEIELSDIHPFKKEMFSLPIWMIDEKTTKRLQAGQRVVFFPDHSQGIEKGVLFSEQNELIGFAEKDGRVLRPRKIM